MKKSILLIFITLFISLISYSNLSAQKKMNKKMHLITAAEYFNFGYVDALRGVSFEASKVYVNNVKNGSSSAKENYQKGFSKGYKEKTFGNGGSGGGGGRDNKGTTITPFTNDYRHYGEHGTIDFFGDRPWSFHPFPVN